MEMPLNPKLILLVEDSPEIQELFTIILNEAGYCVVVAQDGVDAWNRLKNLHPCAVITDLMMPNMNGLELAARIKKSPNLCNIPVALITATPLHKEILDSELLFDRALSKPCEVESLLELAEFLVQESARKGKLIR